MKWWEMICFSGAIVTKKSQKNTAAFYNYTTCPLNKSSNTSLFLINQASPFSTITSADLKRLLKFLLISNYYESKGIFSLPNILFAFASFSGNKLPADFFLDTDKFIPIVVAVLIASFCFIM
jgi:hypothetical protein